MEIDLGRALEMFEERYGRPLTTALLGLVGIGIAAVCINAAFSLILIHLWDYLSKHFRPPEVTIITLFYMSAFIAVAILLIPFWSIISARRRVSQGVVDRLAELRRESVDDILNGTVASKNDLATWKQTEESWRDRVSTVLEQHFPKAEVLGFKWLGLIQPVSFPHAFDNERNYLLSMFAKRLSILEEIIRRHTR